MLWRPHGKRIEDLDTLKNGQRVEGYVKIYPNIFYKKIKDGVIYVENTEYEHRISICRDNSPAKYTVAYKYTDEQRHYNTDMDKYILYDGIPRSKPNSLLWRLLH